MAIVMALILVVAGFVALLVPIVASPEGPASEDGAQADEREALLLERDRLLAALRDIDMDLAMGKVSQDDHADMKRTLEGRAVQVLAALDTDGAPAGGRRA